MLPATTPPRTPQRLDSDSDISTSQLPAIKAHLSHSRPRRRPPRPGIHSRRWTLCSRGWQPKEVLAAKHIEMSARLDAAVALKEECGACCIDKLEAAVALKEKHERQSGCRHCAEGRAYHSLVGHSLHSLVGVIQMNAKIDPAIARNEAHVARRFSLSTPKTTHIDMNAKLDPAIALNDKHVPRRLTLSILKTMHIQMNANSIPPPRSTRSMSHADTLSTLKKFRIEEELAKEDDSQVNGLDSLSMSNKMRTEEKELAREKLALQEEHTHRGSHAQWLEAGGQMRIEDELDKEEAKLNGLRQQEHGARSLGTPFMRKKMRTEEPTEEAELNGMRQQEHGARSLGTPFMRKKMRTEEPTEEAELNGWEEEEEEWDSRLGVYMRKKMRTQELAKEEAELNGLEQEECNSRPRHPLHAQEDAHRGGARQGGGTSNTELAGPDSNPP
ncbi:uncharacterized protein MYCFIDRAFT_180749 [Pseudocercospora fijiensis CIRAD86]|uniref:Uncharacterized protein n=1 Tax=Pseudocercospora fijiensis (strain CIRAD86) TaxID=383855 RepID=M3AHU6_PSEFD|nr:uncharacterized protein MYCFIDRAFT_180749 [Pseudocercospora fijiensis CIRAD86]EME76763.1 hypothetical protein MYCFIDRAFT_180749 [Pseudocercospora fijiensis CIRAD86]